jgi:hypothetical protein
MDVQCGPDTCNQFPMLSATTSSTKMNAIFNTGIKIGDSLSDIRKNNDFGTSTDEHYDSLRTLTPRDRSIGIKIKDSNTNITAKVESSNVTKDIGILDVSAPVAKKFVSITDTKMLKSISSRLKMDDSGSDMCYSVTSSRKSPFQFTNLSKNTSDSQIKSTESKYIGELSFCSNNGRPKLCCGGVYVHSFKDREVCEDVIYQGKWQKYTPKKVNKNRGHITPKRLSEAVIRRKKSISKENVTNNKDSEIKRLKYLPVRKNTLKSMNGDINKPQIKNVPSTSTSTSIKTKKISRNAIKVISSPGS